MDTPGATEDEIALAPLPAADNSPAVAPTPEQTRDATDTLALVLVGLLGLAAALFAITLFRRRRPTPPTSLAARESIVRRPVGEVTPRPVATVAEPAPVAEPVPVLDAAPSKTLASDGAAVALPARIPESYEERDALLRRMIDARPDRANPFTNRKARLHRAR